MTNSFLVFTATFAVLVCILFTHFASADSPRLSGIIDVVQADPYYFSEGGFGISVLKFYGIPLTPYLTPGTTEESTLSDILNFYNTANAKAGVHAIVDDKDRARYYVVHFWDTLNGSKTFTTFAKFQPITTKSPISPVGTTKYSTGFALESLTGKNNQWYYNNIINDYLKERVDIKEELRNYVVGTEGVIKTVSMTDTLTVTRKICDLLLKEKRSKEALDLVNAIENIAIQIKQVLPSYKSFDKTIAELNKQKEKLLK